MSKPKYKRILLKLSGEAMLPPDSSYGVGLATAGILVARRGVVTDGRSRG